MTPAERVDALLRKLDLRETEFFLGGSAALALRDVRHVGDLDIGVTTRYWFELASDDRWNLVTTDPGDELRRCDPPILERQVDGVVVHAFFAWRLRGYADTDYNAIFREEIEHVRSWPCVKLRLLLRQKAAIARPKDLPDIAALARLLEAEAAGAGAII